MVVYKKINKGGSGYETQEEYNDMHTLQRESSNDLKEQLKNKQMERIKEQILNAKLEARRNKMRHECSLLIDLINEKVKKGKITKQQAKEYAKNAFSNKNLCDKDLFRLRRITDPCYWCKEQYDKNLLIEKNEQSEKTPEVSDKITEETINEPQIIITKKMRSRTNTGLLVSPDRMSMLKKAAYNNLTRKKRRRFRTKSAPSRVNYGGNRTSRMRTKSKRIRKRRADKKLYGGTEETQQKGLPLELEDDPEDYEEKMISPRRFKRGMGKEEQINQILKEITQISSNIIDNYILVILFNLTPDDKHIEEYSIYINNLVKGSMVSRYEMSDIIVDILSRDPNIIKLMREFARTPEEEEQKEEDIIKDLEHKKSMLKKPEFNNLFHFIARPNILNIPYKTISPDTASSALDDATRTDPLSSSSAPLSSTTAPMLPTRSAEKEYEYEYRDRLQKREHLEKTYVIYQYLKDKGISDFHDLVNTKVGFFENRKKKIEKAILQILEIQSN